MSHSRVVAVLALLLWLYVVVQADNNGEGPGDDDKQFSPLYFLQLEPGMKVVWDVYPINAHPKQSRPY